MIFLTLLLAVLWAGLVLWIHLNEHPYIRGISVLVTAGLSITLIASYISRSDSWKTWMAASGVLWLVLATWFVWLPPKQDRTWQAEVSKMLTFSHNDSDPDLITLHNVRDFKWDRAPEAEKIVQPKQPHYHKVVEDGGESIVSIERWTDRELDLSKLSGVDIINSYWMGQRIGHTLLSFRFEDERPLTFSIEIRKEQDESFSAIGGFFKQFEMIVVAAEERDIVYTRSNVRGEQVYIFPIEGMSHEQTRALFMAYLQRAEDLRQQAKWYNTLVRNCTTIIFDMAREVTDDLFPKDYRILVSGYVPNYLYDNDLLPDFVPEALSDTVYSLVPRFESEDISDSSASENNVATNNSSHSRADDMEGDASQRTSNKTSSHRQWTMQDWYVNGHINPKVAEFDYKNNQEGYQYSKIIREGLPIPTFKNIKASKKIV